MRLNTAMVALFVLFSPVCMGQTFGFHVVQPLWGLGYHDSTVWDMSLDGRKGVGSSGPFMLDIGIDGSATEVPNGGNYGLSTLISGDGVFSAGTRVDSRPFRRLGLQVELLTTLYHGDATAINGDGSVVGAAASFPFGSHTRPVAYRWTPTGGVQFIVDPFDPRIFYSAITGISSSGNMMCGIGIDALTDEFGFRWSVMGGFQRLPVPAGTRYSDGNAISSDGQMIAGSIDGLNGSRNVLWTPTEIIDMGPVENGPERPTAVSLTGIVAICGDPSSFDAAVWSQQSGRMTLANYLRDFDVSIPNGWRLETCRAISDDGRTFAGSARLPDGTTRGYIATVPNMATLPALVGAIGLLSNALRRRR